MGPRAVALDSGSRFIEIRHALEAYTDETQLQPVAWSLGRGIVEQICSPDFRRLGYMERVRMAVEARQALEASTGARVRSMAGLLGQGVVEHSGVALD